MLSEQRSLHMFGYLLLEFLFQAPTYDISDADYCLSCAYLQNVHAQYNMDGSASHLINEGFLQSLLIIAVYT